MMSATVSNSTHFFIARHFNTSTIASAGHFGKLQWRGREVNAIKSQIKQIPDLDRMKKEDYCSIKPDKLAAIDPSLEDAEKLLPQITEEMERHEEFIRTKMTENKYLSNMYRIKPGEKYSVRKDFKNSIKNGLAKPHWKSYYFQDLSKRSAPLDAVLKAQNVSPLVKMFAADVDASAMKKNNFNSTPMTKSKFDIPSRAPNDVYKTSASSSATVPTTHRIQSSEANSGEPLSTLRQEVESMELDEAASPVRPGPLLLWSMRVQMKHLHESDPDHWTPHVLSYIFLVPEEKVKMVLKSRWYPSSEVEAAEYDKLILQNWEKFSKDGRTFSVALAKKAIEKRLEEHEKGVSGVPAIPVEDEERLKSLIFVEPLEARRQGVAPRAVKGSRPSSLREGGEWVNIVRGYKGALAQLRSPSHATKSSATHAEMAASAGAQNGKHSNAAKHHSRQRTKPGNGRKLMTFDEFLKNKNLT